jgi:hypothetical protein
MSRVKATIVVLVAAFALSAVAAGTASAEWFINGTKLTGSAALATTAKVDTDAVLDIGTIKILCKGGLLRGARPEIDSANEGGMAESLTFEGCETIEPATKCTLVGQPRTITTNPVTATVKKLTGSSKEDRVIFTPLTKKSFAILPFSETNTCALNSEEESVNGSVTVGAPTGQEENEAQAIEGLGSTENNSLEVAGLKAFILRGRALLKLASGSKWSFR